jgi:serine/threonine protein kinase
MIGQKISHYEVMEELGRGGMGAVYKARDLLLDRVLAIKILRPDIANATRERRFIQEAKTASSLNHPNIVTIYEIFHVGEAPCIAMEFISGDTLEKHLESGPLELRNGLSQAIAIADALTRAHAAGIVHRDIKPSNVMITSTGLVKILDFGLAKLTEVSDESAGHEHLTLDGRVVGTPPYLSPEQAKAEKVDARSDIFSLGAVMYEMFTGHRPFERESNIEMLSAVVQDQPKKPRSFAEGLPANLEKIILRCLEKKPERRFQQMEDVREALEAVRQSETLTRLLAVHGSRSRWRSWRIWAPAGVIGAALLTTAVWWTQNRTASVKSAPHLTRITYDDGLTTDPAVSPDGKFLAYASDRGSDALDIWIKPVSGGEPTRLTNHPADDREPTFSPDGSTIAFRSEREGGGIYVTSILRAQDRLIARKGRRPRFSPDGKWLAYWAGFSTGDPTSPGSNKIFILPWGEGAPRQLVPDFESALYPVWSPDGKRVLFLGANSGASRAPAGTLTGTNRPVNRMDWWIATLDDSPPVKTGVHADVLKQGLSVWASSGAGIAPEAWEGQQNRVIFSASFGNADTFRDAVNVWSIPLSSRRWHAAGPAQQITSGSAFESRPALAASGDVYFCSAETRTGIWQLPVNAKTGKVMGELSRLTKGSAFYGQPAVATDGSRVVYYSTKSGNMDVWSLDLSNGTETQLTSTPVGEFAPQISADGSTVYYSIYGKREVYSVAAKGSEPTKICEDCGTWDVSHDGTKILYWYSTAKPLVSIGMAQLPGGEKIEIIQHAEYSLYQPHFSPDDRWITFLAKTGQDRSRVYVVPFKGAVRHVLGDWIPVTDGENLDDKPRWSPDGNLLYFTSERDGFRCIWAQRLDAASKRPAGAPFGVYHFHTSRRSLMNVGLGPLEISVAPNALVFNLGEITGNIWRVSNR